MAYLIAITTAVCHVDGQRKVIKAGATIVRADDPIVKGREKWFRSIETATAAPGEKRTVRKPRKKAQPKAEPESTEATDDTTAE